MPSFIVEPELSVSNILAVGIGDTVIVEFAVEEQPLPFVTVTVNVVLDPGETVIDWVVTPVLHK